MPRKERDEKRRDNKGRLLKSGESQRSDGRYAYKYINTFGEPQFVYSWKLVPTDKVPAGKRPCLSLREKIKQIQKDLDDGIDTIGKKMTVCQLYEKYTRQRGNVRKGTQKSRQQLMKLLSEDKLGAASIDSVKLSDAKEWALRMQEKGVAYNTICNSKRSLKAIFYMAVQDDCLRKNPFDFQINHAFVVCTHIDKPHIHNHIIWSSVSLEYGRKFRNFWGSTKAVRRLSDTICIENGLSMVSGKAERHLLDLRACQLFVHAVHL